MHNAVFEHIVLQLAYTCLCTALQNYQTWHPHGNITSSVTEGRYQPAILFLFDKWQKGKRLKPGSKLSAKTKQINYIVVYNDLIAISIQSCHLNHSLKITATFKTLGTSLLIYLHKIHLIARGYSYCHI